MSHDRPALPINARFLHIGLEVVPVYGNDQCGWSLDAEGLPGRSSALLPYRSLDELVFVLINLLVAHEGTA